MTANVYNSVVDARSWGSNLPESIETARKYYQTVNPGTFYRVFSPVTQVLALLALILFWKSGRSVRVALIVAFLIYAAGDALTFGYFYPRNAIIMGRNSMDMEMVRQAWSEWSTMNWVRSVLVMVGVVFSCLGLHRGYAGRMVG